MNETKTNAPVSVPELCTEIEKKIGDLQKIFEKVNAETERLKAIGRDNLTEADLANFKLLRAINHVALTTVPCEPNDKGADLNTLISVCGSQRGLTKAVSDLIMAVSNIVG